MRNVIYCRVSHQKIHNLSFSKQERSCNEYCKSKNMIVHEIHKEFSSGYAKQKILTNIIKTYKNINLIIYDVSRFSRSSDYGIKLFKICNMRNINLHFVKENLILNSESIENVDFTTCLNASENAWHEIRTNIINNIQMRRIKNMVLGKVPFGFDSINKKLVKNNNFNVIALIVYLRNGNKSIHEIREVLSRVSPNSEMLNFYDEKENVIIKFDRPYTLGFVEIRNILNDFQILDKVWTSRFVRELYKKYSRTVDFIADTKTADDILNHNHYYTGYKRKREYDEYEL